MTDHRIALTLRNLTAVMESDGLVDIHAQLVKKDREAIIEGMVSELTLS